MFQSAKVGVAWSHRPLKTFKTLKHIKIVKQHAPKRLFEFRKAADFLLFNDRKIGREARGEGGRYIH